MRNYNLGFISDEDIFNHVKETVQLYSSHMDLAKFNKNIVDPIKLTFDQKVSGVDMADIILFECLRQEDKANNNHIGYFHQVLFKYAGNGWIVPEQGFDVVNTNKHIFVEMKNKHNTMNSNASQKTYMNMQSKLLEDDKAICMLVEVIAKKSQNIPWKISLNGRRCEHRCIRRVSIDKFYEIVFEDTTSFMRLCKVLPHILDDVLTEVLKEEASNTVLDELRSISPDITKSLYKLAFKTYEGINLFD